MEDDGRSRNVRRHLAYYPPSTFYTHVSQRLDYFLHQRTSLEKKRALAYRLHYVPRDQSADYLGKLEHIVVRRLKDTAALDELFDAIVINEFPNFIGFAANIALPQLAAASYLGPARASGARFYRIQELAAGNVDSRGANLAMYLNSLDRVGKASFNKIMSDSCGYTIEIENIPGHLSIKIGRAGEDNYENLADVGFGFSQFLPIVAQIHAGTSRSRDDFDPRFSFRRRPNALMAIEQPELHLHPGFQAGLGDLFAGSVRNEDGKSTGVRFLIETHSEALVSRFGTLVARGRLLASDVAICFVEKSDTTGFSELTTRDFTGDGSIEEWPVGFFAPEPSN